jgi:hypothetical protein
LKVIGGAMQMSDTTIRERFVTDDAGNRIAVILGLEEYDELVAAMEELQDIRAFDEAKASEDEVIPFDRAIEEIEQERR